MASAQAALSAPSSRRAHPRQRSDRTRSRLSADLAARRPAGLRDCAGRSALDCALVTAAIVLFMAVKGIAYLRPSLLLEHPSASQSQAGSGGFLDPIEGTLLLTAVGIAIAAPVGVAAGDMDERVSAARLAGQSGGVERGDDRGRAECAVGDVRIGAVRTPGAGVPVADLGRRSGLRQVLPHGRGDDVLDRAAAGRGLDTRGAAAGSRRTSGRPPTRWARPRQPRSERSCCLRSDRASPAESRSASGASSATRRSW